MIRTIIFFSFIPWKAAITQGEQKSPLSPGEAMHKKSSEKSLISQIAKHVKVGELYLTEL